MIYNQKITISEDCQRRGQEYRQERLGGGEQGIQASLKLQLKMSNKNIRPQTAMVNRTANYIRNKRNYPNYTNASLSHLQDKTFAVADTWDSKHMDKFLGVYRTDLQKLAHSSNQTALPKYTLEEKFRTNSQVMPYDRTKTNHFAREDRDDLKDSQLLQVVERGKATQRMLDLTKNIHHYATDASCKQTQTYYKTIIDKRKVNEQREMSIEHCRRSRAMDQRFKSGVTGYQFYEQKLKKSRYLKKGLCSDNKWHSNIFEPHSEHQKEQRPARVQQQSNIFPTQNTPNIVNTERTQNLVKNSRRCDYNVITMEQL